MIYNCAFISHFNMATKPFSNNNMPMIRCHSIRWTRNTTNITSVNAPHINWCDGDDDCHTLKIKQLWEHLAFNCYVEIVVFIEFFFLIFFFIFFFKCLESDIMLKSCNVFFSFWRTDASVKVIKVKWNYFPLENKPLKHV